ncbi:unnamed protein product [Rhizoctonia solani]|uniref:Transmembrane protein n=1 Tax=Rhizoctonia solani TaxID=456999 RepID=A0A8H3GUL0_9AGAM|nr:unnamed protein product [Rhizoctonia solani]
MSSPYSNIPLTPSHTPVPVNPLHKAKLALGSRRKDHSHTAPKRSLMKSVGAVWALIAHCILSIWVAVMVFVLIEGHHFNVTDRSPYVQLDGGTAVAPFLPRQSDIVTLLSSVVAVVKYALVAWIAAICWNVAFFLMEKRGLTLHDLKSILHYELLAPGVYSRDWYTWLIGALLLASLAANLSSPILTGSISWVPSNRLVYGLSTGRKGFADVINGAMTGLPAIYYDNYNARDGFAVSAVGRVSLGWGREVDKGIVKRPANLGGLAVNTTFENLTMPYFQVHSIRWIENRDEIPALRNNATPPDILDQQFAMTPTAISSHPMGYAVLVPNVLTNWSSDPVESSTIHDTRLLILYYASDDPSVIRTSLTQNLPSNAYTLSANLSYYAFAWVTFSAGVGQCKQYSCVVSSQYVIRNSTPIELEPHPLTFQALSMAPVIGVWMALQNTSLPYPWDNINDYVEALLVRSYSGAWSSLNSNLYTNVTGARYIPSVPSLLADVAGIRVWIWLGIQLLVTLLSVVFLITQLRLSRYRFVADISLSAFFLNTEDVERDGAGDSAIEARRVEQSGKLLILKDE